MNRIAGGLKPEKLAERGAGELRKADLQDAAVRIFSTRGYHGSSLQEIADRIGILKGSLYYYYQSKEDLLFDVVKAIHDEHLDDALKLSTQPGTPRERLRTLLFGHAAFVCRNIVRATVFLRELDRLPAERRDEIVGPDHAYQKVFRDLIEEAQAAGQIPVSVNAKLATLWILGSLNWLHRWYRADRPYSTEELAESFANQLMRGLDPSPLWEARAKAGKTASPSDLIGSRQQQSFDREGHDRARVR